MKSYRIEGGPLDGLTATTEDEVFEYSEIDDDNLESLLAASVSVAQGRPVLLPTRKGLYRRHALMDGNVIHLERAVYRWEGWLR